MPLLAAPPLSLNNAVPFARPIPVPPPIALGIAAGLAVGAIIASVAAYADLVQAKQDEQKAKDLYEKILQRPVNTGDKREQKTPSFAGGQQAGVGYYVKIAKTLRPEYGGGIEYQGLPATGPVMGVGLSGNKGDEQWTLFHGGTSIPFTYYFAVISAAIVEIARPDGLTDPPLHLLLAILPLVDTTARSLKIAAKPHLQRSHLHNRPAHLSLKE